MHIYFKPQIGVYDKGLPQLYTSQFNVNINHQPAN